MLTLLQSLRIPFLILTPISIFLGFCAAGANFSQFNYLDSFLILICALLAHISVNTLNEYYDFKSGLDLITKKTPFSGGSGALVEKPQSAKAVKTIGFISLLITVAIGIYFIRRYGSELLPLGLLGVAIILSYTHFLNKKPWLCLIAPGISFGPIMIIGSYFILTTTIDAKVIIISLIPFFVYNNLLLLNQYPDADPDKTVGRNHFCIAYGFEKSNHLYLLQAVTAIMVLNIAIIIEYLPPISYIALIPLLASISVWRGATKFAHKTEQLLPYLQLNVIVTLLTPTFLSIALLLG